MVPEYVVIGVWGSFGKISLTSHHSRHGHSHGVLTSVPIPGGKISSYPQFQLHSSLLRLSVCQLPPFSSLTSRLAQCTQPLNIFEYFYLHNINKTLHSVPGPLLWLFLPLHSQLVKRLYLFTLPAPHRLVSPQPLQITSFSPAPCSEKLAGNRVSQVCWPLGSMDTF